MQKELARPGDLLDPSGCLSQVGWSRQPRLDCILENDRFYALHPLQRFRMKRRDYYAVFTPGRFFSATIADLGYAGNIFVYTLDFATGDLHEEGLVIPLGRGVVLPRNSTAGDAHFANSRASLDFQLTPDGRRISVSWPDFHGADRLRRSPGGRAFRRGLRVYLNDPSQEPHEEPRTRIMFPVR